MRNFNDLQFPISRRRLAMFYFESDTYESAVKKMARWIHDDEQLRNELIAVEYHPRQKWFNKRQAEVFRKFFG